MDPQDYSVVIPTYNRLALLKEALDSLERQIVKPAEVIIVDDASSDGTHEFYSTRAQSQGLRIIYYRIEHSGVSAARNHGVAKAKSARVAFLDSDDVWLPQMGETLLKALESRHEVNWVFTNFTQTGNDLQPLPGVNGFKRAYPAFASTDVDPSEFFHKHLRHGEFESRGRIIQGYYGDFFPLLFLGNFVQPSGVMMRKSAFLSAGGFDKTILYAEDTEFFHRLAARQSGMVLMPRSYLWRMDSPHSLAKANTVAMIEAAIESHVRARGLRNLDHTGEGIRRRGFALLYHTYLSALIARGQNRRAREFISRAMTQDRYLTNKTALFFLAALIPSRIILSARNFKKAVRRLLTSD